MSTLSLVTRAETGEVRPATEILIGEAFQERYERRDALPAGPRRETHRETRELPARGRDAPGASQ